VSSLTEAVQPELRRQAHAMIRSVRFALANLLIARPQMESQQLNDADGAPLRRHLLLRRGVGPARVYYIHAGG
jgi:hypothetical protein